MIYDEKFCIAILKRNGWIPRIPEGHQLGKEWVLMALQIASLENLYND